MLAHAGGADESLALLLLAAGLWTGWAVVSRARGTGFPGMPVVAAWGLGFLSVALLVSALVVPRSIFPPTPTPTPTATSGTERPASDARLAIGEPRADQRIDGDELDVVMQLDGGTIVESTSTRIEPDTGHIHLMLDGRIVSMTYGLVQVVDLRGLAPGEHTLEAQFVAADHGPFHPPVTDTITFRIGSGAP